MTNDRRSHVRDVLLVSWALIAYYRTTHMRFMRDETYGLALLLWLALTAWGLGRIALALVHTARARPRSRPHFHSHSTSGASPDARFTTTYEEHHDDPTYRSESHDDELRDGSVRAPR